ncbi:TPM domain-containing protein [Varibaculum cambriense]|uniref:TPM domain-containing protein n=1 Tax=Varibaculum cambriense TaxID=184870 RepID=UPI002915A591|nr:TPM domain-containing protein [Varibaculum cambriense]MDU3273732.1 TPM domain-containing protein [Varibaculum cambriense]
MCLARFRKRLLIFFLAVLAATVTVVAPASLALASPPASSFDKHLSDPAGYLDNSEQVEETLAGASSSDYQIYAALTDNFSPLSAQQWCVKSREQATSNSQGVLLAIAVKERSYYICPAANVRISENKQNRIVQGLEPLLSQGNWDQAVKVFAVSAASSSSDPGGAVSEEESARTGDWFRPLALVLVIAGIGIGIMVFARKQSKTRDQIKTRQAASDKQLVEQAGIDVLTADDAVRGAQEELEFAKMQLGTTQTEEYVQVLAQASQVRDSAMEKLRDLDSLSGIQKSQQAQAASSEAKRCLELLAQQTENLTRLRESLASLPSRIQSQLSLIAELETQAGQLPDIIAALHKTHPQAVLTSLDDAPEQVSNLLGAARETLEPLQSEESSTSVKVQVQTAERAIAQARTLIQEVSEAETHLANLQQSLLEAVTSISSDLDDVKRLNLQDKSVFQTLCTNAQTAIDNCLKARDGQGDPLASLSAIAQAEADLDQALAPHRQNSEQKQKAAARLQTALASAQARIASANSYVSSHRGAVGLDARQYLARADSLYQQAQASRGDTGIKLAELAGEAADKARESASLDYQERRNDWDGRPAGNSSDFLTGMILGGILNGGRGFGGGTKWGSSNGNSDWFGGGFGGGSGSGFGGSFGGGNSGGGFGGKF